MMYNLYHSQSQSQDELQSEIEHEQDGDWG